MFPGAKLRELSIVPVLDSDAKIAQVPGQSQRIDTPFGMIPIDLSSSD